MSADPWPPLPEPKPTDGAGGVLQIEGTPPDDTLYEHLTIGDYKLHELPELSFSATYKSKRKIDEKESSGAGDATATDKGRGVRDVSLKLSWPDRPSLNRGFSPIIKALDPGGPKGGKPFDWAHDRNGLDMGDIKQVRAVLIKDCDGPNVEPGSGVVTCEFALDSWVKPSAQAGAGKTPDDKDKQDSDDDKDAKPDAPKPPDVDPDDED